MVLMIMSNFKYSTMSGLIVIFLALTNVVQAEGAPAIQEKIPPAPLGPYVSTGLLESEVDTSVAESLPVEVVPAQNSPAVAPVPGDDKKTDNKKALVTKPTVQLDTNKMPMEAFSPDIPWPADMRPPLSQSSARRMHEQMMPGYGGRQLSTENRRQQNSQQQSRSFNYRAPVTNHSDYSGRLIVPQAANQQMKKMSNTGQPGYRYQMPSSYLPQNNFSSGNPAGSMPNPYYYQPGYTN